MFHDYLHRAETLFAQGKIQEALKEFYWLNEQYPNSPEILNNLGVALYELGQLDKADNFLSQVLNISSEFDEAKKNLDAVRAIKDFGGKQIQNERSKKKHLSKTEPEKEEFKFVYLDSGLVNNVGHHANSARFLTTELRNNDIDVLSYSHRGIEQSLKRELDVIPLFRIYTYANFSKDPLSGWLDNFFPAYKYTLEDLHTIVKPSSKDVLFWNSAQPAQLKAVIAWWQAVYPEAKYAPVLNIELGTDGGAQIDNEDNLNVYTPKARLYRHASHIISKDHSKRLRIFTYDKNASEVYEKLLNLEVTTLDPPHQATGNRINRLDSTWPLTIGIIGHQRGDKGFHLVQPVLRKVMERVENINILVHNGSLYKMSNVTQELQLWEKSEPRLEVVNQPADMWQWAKLLDQIDLMLLPYQPLRFQNSYSAVAIECLAHGIPAVVPANTSLSKTLNMNKQQAIEFENWEVADIVEATISAIENYNTLAKSGEKKARDWAANNSLKKVVSTLLEPVSVE